MTRITHMLALTTALVAAPLAAHADSWTLSGEGSALHYGSIKKDKIGEVNTFGNLSGSVSDEGVVTVEIDLASVETYIDIRNERMVEHVFGKDNPTATITAQVDAGALDALKPGEMSMVDVEGTLTFAGKDVPIETAMVVTRLSDERAMVSTDGMIMLTMEELGLDGGIDKLMELAKLPGITRVAPVTMRLVFDKSAPKGSSAEKVAAAAMVKKDEPKEEKVAAVSDGDAKKGKKVFRKCKACHVVDKEKNKVGPHLVGIVGRASGSVDGFKYSKAMAGADLTWDAETLAGYLANPKKYMPGNKMAFGGLRKEEQVADVIAYLAEEAK